LEFKELLVELNTWFSWFFGKQATVT